MNTRTTPTSAKNAENSSSLAAGLATLRASTLRQRATWQDTDSVRLMNLVAAIVDEGSLVSFSRTSDGGALVLTILTDKLPQKFYAADSDELDALVTSISEVVKHTT